MILEKAAPDTQSEIGLEYHQHFSGPLRQILMAGEREWLNNAASDYAWQSPEIWEQRILPHLTQGTLQSDDYDDMIRFCPNMLAALSRQRITTTKDHTLMGILSALK
jgi:hypothetical protein